MAAIIAPDSSHRGFLETGTGRTFTFDNTALGLDEGVWDDSLPFAGQSLDDLMQQVIAAVTGIPGNLVRPRWQEELTNIPSRGTDWAAIGVIRSVPIGYPYAKEIDNGNGFSKQLDTEEFEVLCSFYGPNADLNAIRLRSGLMVDQNREAFQLLNMGLIQTTGRTRVPELVKDIFLMRIDITFSMRRQVKMYYPVLFFLSDSVEVITDTGYHAYATTPTGTPVPSPPEPQPEVFDIPFQYLGAPRVNLPVLLYPFATDFTFLNGLSGCSARAQVASTSSVVFDLAKNGVNFGTMTYPPGVPIATFAGSLTHFHASDLLSVTMRNADSSLALLSGNLVGTSP